MEPNTTTGQGWGIAMTTGVLMIILGVLAVFAAVLTSIVSAVFIGGLLAAVGVLEVVTAFRVRHGGPFWTYLLAGLLSLVIGVLFLSRPLAGAATLTLLIAAYLFSSGLFRGLTSVSDRYRRWGWDFSYGIVAVLLGAYVVASWPSSALWVLGTVVGLEIVARGMALIAASWVLREVEHHAAHVPG